MTIEQTDGLAPEPNDTPLPDAADTAAPVESAEATTAEPGSDDTVDDDGEPNRKPTGVQKRIAEITREKHDALRRAAVAEALLAERERVAKPTEATPQDDPTAKPTVDQFTSYEDFTEALSDWKVDQKLAEVEQRKSAKEAATAFETKVAAVREKHPDFDSVVLAPTNPVSPAMADAFRELDNGADVAYHLATNRAEAVRINALPPVRQIAELTRLADRLATPTATPPKLATDAPTPPPAARGSGGRFTVSADTTDFAAFEAQYGTAG